MPSAATAGGGLWTGWPADGSAFIFEVDGVEIGTFSSVEGLRIDVDVVEYSEGGGNGFVHRLPGRVRWPNLVLKRGIVKSDSLLEWMQNTTVSFGGATSMKLVRSTAAVTLLNEVGARIRSWNLEGAFPVAWRGPTLDARAPAAAEEELEIAHHGFKAQTF